MPKNNSLTLVNVTGSILKKQCISALNSRFHALWIKLSKIYIATHKNVLDSVSG